MTPSTGLKPRVIIVVGVVLVALAATIVILRMHRPVDRDPARMRDKSSDGPTFRRPSITDPKTAVERLRKEWESGGDGQAVPSPGFLSIRENVIVFGDRVVPWIDQAVLATSDRLALRIPWIDVLAEMKGAQAERLLVSILTSSILEEQLRLRALVKLRGRATPAVVLAIKQLASDPGVFSSRELILKAVGAIPGEETTRILLKAARTEAQAVARLTAVQVLASRRSEEGVEGALVDIMQSDADDYVRLTAIRGVTGSRRPDVIQAVQRLRDTAETPELLRSAAQNALRQP